MPAAAGKTIFRRSMVELIVGKLAKDFAGLLLFEMFSMVFIAPRWVTASHAFFLTHGKLTALCLSSFGIGTVGFWGSAAIFTLPALVGTTTGKIQASKQMDVRSLLRSLPLTSFNFVIGTLAGTFVFTYGLPERSFDFHNLPTWTTLARDVLVWLIVNEVLFFYVHRWLHLNKVSLVAIYCHPLEHIFSNVMPLVAGPLLCGSHYVSISIFFFGALVHTSTVHSGYWVCDDHGLHDEHHRMFNVNFGALGIMDQLYGSYSLPPTA
eukprot:TRINITY_DN14843_c0_g1_i3.p1 TRINITY_DN14843_c0_g1~~TRINITY_DN14843_c0_g1_i3.p1  ORF type:complete len:265 (+),score=46.20 TRINITY_DN14843_c0_g1_i3:193-987(+)